MNSNTTHDWTSLDVEQALAALNQPEHSLTLPDLLAVGTLHLRGQRDRVPSWVHGHKQEARTLLQRISFEPLDDAAVGICSAALELWSAAAPTRSREQALSGLRDRDRIERLLLGCEVILGEPVSLTEDAETYLAEFESMIRPELWRLVVVNDERKRELSKLNEESRTRCWWWSVGADVPSDAPAALRVAAHYAGVFPEAIPVFQELVVRQVQTQAPGSASAEALAAARPRLEAVDASGFNVLASWAPEAYAKSGLVNLEDERASRGAIDRSFVDVLVGTPQSARENKKPARVLEQRVSLQSDAEESGGG